MPLSEVSLGLHDLKWSGSEKKIARRAFDAALEATKAGIVAEFKARAAAVVTLSDMWAIEDHLRQQHRTIDELFDYRYSKLLFVFARLIGQGYLDEEQLAGLSDEKLDIIRRSLKWMKEG
jgi:hypothetical protein